MNMVPSIHARLAQAGATWQRKIVGNHLIAATVSESSHASGPSAISSIDLPPETLGTSMPKDELAEAILLPLGTLAS